MGESWRKRRELIDTLRPVALARIHQQEIDPIAFTEAFSPNPPLYNVVLEIETLKNRGKQEHANAEAVRPAADKAKANRDAEMKDAEADVASLEAKLQKARERLAAIAVKDAAIINRAAYLESIAQGTLKRANSLENAIHNPFHPLPDIG